MPTRRGWGMVAGCAAVIVLGRLLGLVDLYMVGVCGILLTAVAVGWVRLARVEVEATRRLRPNRVPVGAPASVEVSLRNASRRRSPAMNAFDQFDDGRLNASWLVAPIAGGETVRTSYPLPTERRGVFPVGPLRVELLDPFGLALTRVEVLASTTLTVHPLAEVIASIPRGRGGGAQGGSERPPVRGQSGDDFYALRPYAAGDDLRRVHWPSTARRGEIMIRQDDHPWQDRTAVLLDVRGATPPALEAAVSAAASVLSSAGCGLVRLVHPTEGPSGPAISDSGDGTGPAHLSAMLDHLAAVRAGQDGEAVFGQALGRLRDTPGGGTLVVVTCAAAGPELELVAAMSPRFSPVIVVAVGSGGAVLARGVRGWVVPLVPGGSFAKAWDTRCLPVRPRRQGAVLPGSAR